MGNMYQMYQSCPLSVVSTFALRFGRRGYTVAQPLDHSWLHSVPESRRKPFLRMLLFGRSGIRVQRTLVQTLSTNHASLMQHLFFCSDGLGFEPSGLLFRQRLLLTRSILQNLFVCSNTFGLEFSGLWSGCL